MLDLDALKRLEKAATPKPWEQDFDEGRAAMYVLAGEKALIECYAGPHDAAFIAALRNAAPELIEVYRAAKAWSARKLNASNALEMRLRAALRLEVGGHDTETG